MAAVWLSPSQADGIMVQTVGGPHSSSSQVTNAPWCRSSQGPGARLQWVGQWLLEGRPASMAPGGVPHLHLARAASALLSAPLLWRARGPGSWGAGRPGREPSSVCRAGAPSTDGPGPGCGHDGGWAWEQNLSDTSYTLFRSDPTCCPGEHHRAAQDTELRRGRKWVAFASFIVYSLPPSGSY